LRWFAGLEAVSFQAVQGRNQRIFKGFRGSYRDL